MLYLQLLWAFFKIGALSFGGGMAMIPIIQQEMAANGWMSQQEVTDLVAVSEMTPGTLAINAATFAGVRTGGILGAIVATLGVVLPSMIISLLAAKFYFAVRDNKLVGASMTGIRPAVAGMLGAAAVQMLLLSSTNLQLNNIVYQLLHVDVFTLLVAAITFVILICRKASPIILIFLSGILGIIRHLIIKLFL